METWLIYAILSIFFSGFYAFFVKVASEKNYNSSLISGYGYVVGAFFALLYFLYKGEAVTSFWIIGFFSFVNVIFYFFSILTRMEGMKHIDSVIFFPLYKTFSPIFITIVAFTIFQESLTLKEGLGVLLGIGVPLMLITTRENKIQKNLKKGVLLVLATSLLVTVSNGFAKGFMLYDLNIEFYIFLTMSIGAIISGLSYKTIHHEKRKSFNKKGIIPLGLILGLFHFLTFYTFQKALSGNLAIVFTLNSFSILIPIILSIIFYKEHFSYKKGFVIFLSILSALMFI